MREHLFKCYCDSRKIQFILSKTLTEDDLSDKEKELIQNITLEIQTVANKIKCFCEQGDINKS
ncbi:hypothetical protein H5P36_11015 [Bacillus sp. APMAM]|nr:hypothetical protein [Bacillus sp. APMAM]RTZ55914.1 hypothetical protein EKO25_10605 [Bacillus sp. SAJ1]